MAAMRLPEPSFVDADPLRSALCERMLPALRRKVLGLAGVCFSSVSVRTVSATLTPDPAATEDPPPLLLMLLLLLLLVLSSRNAGGGGRFSRLPFAMFPIPALVPLVFWWMTELLEIEDVRRIGGGGFGT